VTHTQATYADLGLVLETRQTQLTELKQFINSTTQTEGGVLLGVKYSYPYTWRTGQFLY